ncbi:MAG TPA: spore gernimation protein [Firmicutes bacterium]|nr:spore gernimation protein [Bacillota bacterium]HHY98129.1 spore gernimation protein [Bacillota bacterium]
MRGSNTLVTSLVVVLIIVGLVATIAYMVSTDTRLRKDLSLLKTERDKLVERVDDLETRVKSLERRVPSLTSSKVTLYFARSTEKDIFLQPVPTTVQTTENLPKAALEALAKGPPPGSGLSPTLPPDTRVLGVTVKDGTAFADFSSDIRAKFPGGSRTEEVLVYSIVNTLTSLPGISKVQILIDGRKTETIGGHMGIAVPLSKDESLVRR